MTVRRLLDSWKRTVAATPVATLREALTLPLDSRVVEEVAKLAILEPDIVRTTLGPLSSVISSDTLFGAEIVNALACTGVPTSALVQIDKLPKTPRGALAALATKDATSAARLLPEGQDSPPRVDDVAATVRELIGVVRDGKDQNEAFPAWHMIVRSCVVGITDATTLLGIARIVVHDVGARPLGSVAAWVRDQLEKRANDMEAAAVDSRERARIALVADPVRRIARPEARLRVWERAARPIDELIDEPLADLGRELARSVLVDPRQQPAKTRVIFDRLLASPPTAPEARLAILDSINALSCAGVDVPSELASRVADWGPALDSVGPPLALRIRAGLCALAARDLQQASRIAPSPPGQFYGGREFPNDVLALLGYVTSATAVWAAAATLDNALHRVGEELDELCDTGQLDESTLLWLARVAFHGLGQEPLGEVAARIHDLLWRIPAELEDARREAATHAPAFPLLDTFGGGRYRVERRLRGEGSQRLYSGVEIATGESVLITFDTHYPRKQNVDELLRAISYSSPGVLDLVHVGTFDTTDSDAERDRQRLGHWMVVEKPRSGRWLPDILGPADPWTAVRKALELGVTAGQILVDAADRGQHLAYVRPEWLWAERHGGHYTVTGLSDRGASLLQRRGGESNTLPIFDRFYTAPEAATAADDRSVVFALAAMIAEWATGRIGLSSQEIETLSTIGLPSSLRVVLAAATRAAKNDRPRLTELLEELLLLHQGQA